MQILIRGQLSGLPGLALQPGQRLSAAEAGACLQFLPGSDGVCLSADNGISGLSLLVSPERRALHNLRTRADLGRIELSDLTVEGQVQLIASGSVQRGSVSVSNLDIRRADTRQREEVASGNGVRVMQGALTVWNQQTDARSRITAHLHDVRIGSKQSPVLGGGIFLSGEGSATGGRLSVDLLHTHSVHVDSGLPIGTTDTVAAAVFILHGATAQHVRSAGPVETYGPNCVALDNWGEVAEWIAESDVRSHGPSAIAIVNAGRLELLRIEGAVETLGEGARGMSIYADTGAIQMRSVVTRGNAATAIHVTRSVRRLTVAEGITTYGSSGDSLVKGVMHRMHADGIEIEPGAAMGDCRICGSVRVHGNGAAAFRIAADSRSTEV